MIIFSYESPQIVYVVCASKIKKPQDQCSFVFLFFAPHVSEKLQPSGLSIAQGVTCLKNKKKNKQSVRSPAERAGRQNRKRDGLMTRKKARVIDIHLCQELIFFPVHEREVQSKAYRFSIDYIAKLLYIWASDVYIYSFFTSIVFYFIA